MLFEDHKIKYANVCNQTALILLLSQSMYFICDVDDLLYLKTLMAQLGHISESFILFGSDAGLSPASLKEIVAKSSSPHDSMGDVCDLWLQKCREVQTPPTWHTVSDIPYLIGHKELSKKLLHMYAAGTSNYFTVIIAVFSS